LLGEQAQGFVIRVDLKAKREAEQVQFYRCYPNTDLQQITAKTFPDLDSLRVHFKLKAQKPVFEPQSVRLPEEEQMPPAKLTMGAYVPGILLLVLALAHFAASLFLDTDVLGVATAVLLVGGAVLLSLPALLRYAMTFFTH